VSAGSAGSSNRASARAANRASAAKPRRYQTVDYALARRALLADLFGGRAASLEVCDAHPYLLRAARYYGEVTEDPCPVCRRGQSGRLEPLVRVTYVYGDDLGSASGRPRRGSELDRLARAHPGIGVYVVEVCQVCSWNHLVTSYRLGVH
jgi:hypothetical protein